jgi:hypothetical protein
MTYESREIPHERFAWWPVQFEDGRMAWLETVNRVRTFSKFGPPEYRCFYWAYTPRTAPKQDGSGT